MLFKGDLDNMLNNRMITLAAIIGTFLEWAEYCFYGYSATKIGSLFFPQLDKSAGILAAFAVFALGYVARPVGAVIFGYIGDVYGRKKALSSSILLMGLATLAIGLLPTYTDVGLLAPILLISARLIQGVAVAGEFNGASIFLIEHADPQHQYLAGSWVPAAASAGMLFGAGIVAFTSSPWMPDWSWRIPFFIGTLSCIIGHLIRKNAAESPEFVAFRKTQVNIRFPLIEVLKEKPLAFAKTMAIAAFVGIYVYTGNIFFTAYLIQTSHFSITQSTWLAAFGQACATLLMPLFALYADKKGGNGILTLGLLLSAIVAPLNLFLANQHNLGLAIIAELLYALANSLFSATIFKYLYDLFPIYLRYTGITFAWSLSVALLGGTAPLIASYLGSAAGLYVSAAALLALLFTTSKR